MSNTDNNTTNTNSKSYTEPTSITSKSKMRVIKVSDWRETTDQVAAVGGRVVRMHDQSILVVELPPHATPASVGADHVLERQLSESSRCVTSRWRPVAEPQQAG